MRQRWPKVCCRRAPWGLGLSLAGWVSAGVLLSPAWAWAAETTSRSFTTAGENEFVVPPGVMGLQVTLVGGVGAVGGAGSSGSHSSGGAGATVTATLTASPGETLFAETAGDGKPNGAGGYNGGGSDARTGETGGGGGGASDVRTCSVTATPSSCAGGSSLASRLVVAGGGGGGGRGGADTGDAAVIKGGTGGAAGQPGGEGAFDTHGDAGGEGGQAGGSNPPGGAPGGHSFEPATQGQHGVGGAGGTSFAAAGGGGGGGVYGGGGGGGGLQLAESMGAFNVFNSGGGGGGGGGSGFAGGVSSFLLQSTTPGAQPAITFTWTLPPPAASTGGATGLTATGATLTGNVNPDGSTVTDCHFAVSPAPPSGTSVPCSQQVGAGESPIAVTATLNALSPATAYTATLMATSPQGSASGAAVGFVTSAASTLAFGPGGLGGSGAALSVSNLKLSTARFRAGKHTATIAQSKSMGAPTATTISFGLSQAATVKLSFEQAEAGVITGHKCSAASKAHSRGRRCTRYAAVSHSVSRAAQAGTDSISFDGVLDGGRSLSPGTYRVSLVATGATGRATAAQHPTFTLLA